MEKRKLYIFLVFLVFGFWFFYKGSSEHPSPVAETKITQKEPDRNTSPEISKELMQLESSYVQLLEPILELKKIDPDTYWFIVSWLNTNYRTPDWNGYSKEGWRELTKARGIDCSGFARVMQDQIFNKKIRGGSQGILDNYCYPKKKEKLEKGDLVFFKAHKSKNNRITHVGIYLFDGYFVHATSPESAAKGLGLNVNSLNEPYWAQDFISGGEIK